MTIRLPASTLPANMNGRHPVFLVRLRSVRILALGAWVLSGTWRLDLGASDATRPSAPYDTHPALRALMDAVTFHHSFDHESLAPDMAVGEWKFQRHGEPKLAPGLLGKALVAGTGALFFADARNWTIATRGALVLWVSPVRWNHHEAGNTYFVVSQRAAFYLERQGPLPKPDRSPGRQEVVLAGLQGGLRGSRGADCKLWKDGEWHMLAVNWSWPQLALSLDGGAFSAIEFREKPDASLSGG
ncbi:MAG: hypothetical protein FJ279_37295, partial [Planctomycetes bacterium]|nr:hypothetical protein [Planctomycetota bacterium]